MRAVDIPEGPFMHFSKVHAYDVSVHHRKKIEITCLKMEFMSTFSPMYATCLLNAHCVDGEHPDEMQHNASFHKGQHYVLRQKRSSEILFYFQE